MPLAPVFLTFKPSLDGVMDCGDAWLQVFVSGPILSIDLMQGQPSGNCGKSTGNGTKNTGIWSRSDGKINVLRDGSIQLPGPCPYNEPTNCGVGSAMLPLLMNGGPHLRRVPGIWAGGDGAVYHVN